MNLGLLPQRRDPRGLEWLLQSDAKSTEAPLGPGPAN